MSRNRQSKSFRSAVARVKRHWQLGLMVDVLLRFVGWLTVVSLVYGLLDLFLAFAPGVRVACGVAIIIILGCMTAITGMKVLRLCDSNMARRCDRLLTGRRQPILSALELEKSLTESNKTDESFYTFLVQRSIKASLTSLQSIPFSHYFPFRELGKRLRIVGLQLAVSIAVICLQLPASRVIGERLLFPLRDVPPYSRLTFTVNPLSPRVIYSGDTDVSVEIGGGAVRSQVWLLTRHGGTIHRAACFQESGQSFAQRLERVVVPLEFCFKTGRARSKWYQIDLRLQPQIAFARVTLTPPAYSRRTSREFLAGDEPLQGLPHSKARLLVASNRPLLDGTMQIRPRNGAGGEHEVMGVQVGTSSVEFEWEMTSNAELQVVVRDVRGTENREPFILTQILVPDASPEVAITQPAGFALATPSVTVPIEGQASDDLGLRRVELVRSVVGYRDRIKTLGLGGPDRKFEFSESLELERVGAEPGQTLEFYLEASDLNPTMLGFSSSDIVRIQVISEEEYAAMLRARSTTEEFVERYYAIERQLDVLKDELRKLQDVAESSRATQEDRAAQLRAAQAAARDALSLFNKLANDFPAYDIERSLASVLKGVADEMVDTLQPLSAAKADSGDLAGLAEDLLKELGDAEQKIFEQTRQAEEIAQLARVMECAGRFNQVVQRQRNLVRQLSRFEQDSPGGDVRLLKLLGKRQADIRSELNALIGDIEERADALPSRYMKLASSAKDFAELIKKQEVLPLMNESVVFAQNQEGKQSHHSSRLALERLEDIMSSCQGGQFGGMCQGGMTFQVPQGMKQTLEEMLAAMAMRLGRGQKPGQGSGPSGTTGMGGSGLMGGDGGDGFWMRGQSPLNVPVFGPSRMSFRNTSESGVMGTGPNAKSGRGVVSSNNRETIRVRMKDSLTSESTLLERVPEKYRDAVKRYFSAEGAAPGTTERGE